MTDPAAHTPAGAPDVDTLVRDVLYGIGSHDRAAQYRAGDALSDLAATARERDYKLVDSSVAADRDRLARRVVELEAALEPFAAYRRWQTAKGMRTSPPALGPKELDAAVDALAGDGGGA